MAKKYVYLYNVYHVPGTTWSLFANIRTEVSQHLWLRCYFYSHFTEEGIEANGGLVFFPKSQM